jgi:hypothetical protein
VVVKITFLVTEQHEKSFLKYNTLLINVTLPRYNYAVLDPIPVKELMQHRLWKS